MEVGDTESSNMEVVSYFLARTSGDGCLGGTVGARQRPRHPETGIFAPQGHPDTKYLSKITKQVGGDVKLP